MTKTDKSNQFLPNLPLIRQKTGCGMVHHNKIGQKI